MELTINRHQKYYISEQKINAVQLSLIKRVKH
jgi:hypothetical protein